MAVDVRERPVNVKDLVIDQPERSMPFDLGRDVTVEDIYEIKQEVYGLEKLRPETGFYLKLASNLKMLYPNIDLVLNEKVVERQVLPQLDQDMRGAAEMQLAGMLIPSTLLALKTLFPSRVDFYSMTDEHWTDVLRSFAENKGIVGISTGTEYLRDFKISSPDRYEQLGLGDLDWKSLLKGIEKQRREGFRSRMALVSLAASARILFPEKFSRLVNDDEIREAVEYMHHQRKLGNRDFFLNVALDLAILTADEITINDSGLTVVEKKSQELMELPPLPEAKKF